MWKEQGNTTGEWTPLAVTLGGLGLLTAIANVLSARGSRFWQENWEKHIDMLEDEFEGRLYKTVLVSDTLYVSLKYLKNFDCAIISPWILLPIAAVTLLGFWRLIHQTSDFYGTRPKADGSHDYDRRFENDRRPVHQEFIRRYAPDEFPVDDADIPTIK